MIQARLKHSFAAQQGTRGFDIDVEFTVDKPVTALFGPSGAGKTTVLEAVAGFLKPRQGRILLDDRIVFDAESAVHVPPRHRRCGYVFQNPALLPHLSVEGNLQFAGHSLPARRRKERVEEMLNAFQLEGVRGSKPNQLSGGQKQRCSIARALVPEPSILLLDEPSRGLDLPLREDFYGLLRGIRKNFGVPMLLVTHDVDECCELADEVLLIREGRLADSGSPTKVFREPADIDSARLYGHFNVLPGEILHLDPSRNVSKIHVDGGEVTGPYLPGHFKGDRVRLAVMLSEVLARPINGKLQTGEFPGTLVRAVEAAEQVRLEFAGGLRAYVSVREYHAAGGSLKWAISVRPDSLRVI